MRHLLLVATALALSALAGAATASRGVYAQRQLESPLVGPILPRGADAGIYTINGLGLSVPQRIAGTTNQSASVPICLSFDRTRVGHTYAEKRGAGYVSRCHFDGGVETGAVILQPTTNEQRNVKWTPMVKGQALPAQLAPVEFVGTRRVPLYVCKAGTPYVERAGTLLADGSCRLAPTLTEQATTVGSSQVLMWSATGSAAPRYGWISLAAGFHHPGGELVKWPSGAIYCVVGGTPGEIVLAQTETSFGPVGSVRACRIREGGGWSDAVTSIRVFRNDGQSGVQWSYSGGTEMSEAHGTPCVASDGAQGVRRTGVTFCESMSGVRNNFKTLRRTGVVPGEDRG